jgi:DNA replication protein DnaC
MNLVYLIGGISSLFTILWSLPFLITNYINIRLYKSASQQKFSILKKLIKGASIWQENEPEGIIYGYWFIGIISSSFEFNGKNKLSIFIIASPNFLYLHDFMSKEVKNEDIEDEVIDNTKKIENVIVNYYEREGNYYHFKYNLTKLSIDFNPKENQVKAIDQIVSHNKKNVNTVVLLSGQPGKGKSMIPILIAKQLNYSLVDSFNPTDPGDAIINLINSVNPTLKKKLIIVIEEVDTLIMNIHNENIKQHKEVPVQIKNKQSWNTFFDKIDKKIYQNLIICMTTNKTINFFNELDPSYMRDGRISMNLLIS